MKPVDLKELILLGGTAVYVDFSRPATKCRSCDAEIRFGATDNNKWLPIEWVEADVWQAHFTTCPQANQHRKKRYGRR